jgi:primosomal protein N' (replication factor Y) (superfamily II helicase)
MVVGVLVQLSNKNIDRIFDYNVPLEMMSDIKIGIRVKVPFGYQKLEGFVLEIKDNSSTKLKDIFSVVDKDIVLDQELLELGKKMSAMYLAPLISCYQVMLPKALKAQYNTLINKKYDTYYKLNNKEYKYSNNKQLEIINMFNKNELVIKSDLDNISSSSVKTLVNNGVLSMVKKEHYRLVYKEEDNFKYPLTSEQLEAVNKVRNDPNGVYLLHGVTGSGKTEVYMELIEDNLKLGKTSIVLVPEISLTPQMVSRFQRRFGDKIAALHSALSEGEKYDEWRRIARGEASIVIGARSAIFAPVHNLGIIIIDEEHSDSYKQDSTPRYNAKDIAILRATANSCPVVMGSATPSLESYARSLKGVYKLINLPHRINGKNLPLIRIVDMNEEIKKSKGHFSRNLITSITDKLEKHEQIILLLNRRGYASFVTCHNCGYTFKCPHCDITLTYHKTSNTLRCHYCGYATKVYDTCPNCGEKAINNIGVGTEKIEEELHSLFPETRVIRMDFDTTSGKGKHEELINKFKNGEADILLGTQIVAKGLDFPNVTLVGVINADTSLNIPDFRSSENTFSLLSQVAGRSGRSSKTGEVIIQTFNPDHYAIRYTKEHNYLGFYQEEMKIRYTLKYPPYYYLCQIRIMGKDLNYVSKEASLIKRALAKDLAASIILGPTPGNPFKLSNTYYFSIILKYKNDPSLIKTLEAMQDHYKSDSKLKIDINFNPTQIA